ncbi:MAG: hypothetical protein WC428_01785 [Candidatus Paceibacterota bacterium]|jgi:hypothetical protein
MEVCFRIRETKNSAGETVYKPERIYIHPNPVNMIAGQKPKEEKWVNITYGFGCPWYMDFEAAKNRIKEYVEEHKKATEKFFMMDEFNFISKDEVSEQEPVVYNHAFTEIHQILAYLKSKGVSDQYLIQGLENSIKERYYFVKGGNVYCG